MNERLSGEGKVYKGQQFIADVHYALQIDSYSKTTRTMEGEGRFPAGKSVQLRISPATKVSGQFGPERLTLHLSDGRKQDFFVSTSNGDCTATGGPYR
jgi:hypothetical protein